MLVNGLLKILLFQDIPEEIVPIEDDEDEDDPLFEFTMQKSLRSYMEMLSDKKGLPSAGISKQLKAELRPYQEEGYDWLVFMRDNQFGAVLADDMGLGKTVQLITYLLNVHARPETEKPSLIICPTSVLGTGKRKLNVLLRHLSVHTHYGPSREKDEDFTELDCRNCIPMSF